jgi:hypothetical protein
MASPLALWHLLSLDAPTVATLWTCFIARVSGVRLPSASALAMAVAVWLIYAGDRLLDAARAHSTAARAELETRHRFHDRHRRAFTACIAVSALALGVLLPLLDAAALRLYLFEGALLVLWFAALHVTHNAHRLPKETAVGIFFSAAVFIPTVARNPGMRAALALPALLLGVLCALNCLFIYAWEHVETGADRAHGAAPHPTTRFALQRLPAIAIAELVSSIALAALSHGAVRLIAVACALSSALLLCVHLSRQRYSQSSLDRIHLRAAADLALLTPAMVLAWWAVVPR